MDDKELYDLIISPEVRNFYKENVKLDIYEKEQVILRSFIPLEKKIQYLKGIETQGNKREAHSICRMREYLRHCLDEIYHPSMRSLFVTYYREYTFEEMRIEYPKSINDYFDTVEEIIDDIDKTYNNDELKRQVAVSVDFLQFPSAGKHTEPFSFEIFWLEDRWQVKDIRIHSSQEEEQSLIAGKSVMERLTEYEFSHPIPFENGCRLKLQLPFMKTPFCGTLFTEKDGNGRWYHFLYSDDDPEMIGNDFIDLGYSEIDLYSGYNTWDWIERV